MATQIVNTINLPLFVMVGAGVALFVYFFIRRTHGKVSPASWAVVGITACAGFASSWSSLGSPSALVIPDRSEKRDEAEKSPDQSWTIHLVDTFEKWKIYSKLPGAAESLPPRLPEKAWVDDAAGSTFQHWGGKKSRLDVHARLPSSSTAETVGYSGPELDAATAMNVARRDAANQLRALLARRYSLTLTHRDFALSVSELDRVAREIVEARLDEQVVDTYEEDVLRPGVGRIYRAAVKVRADNIEAINEQLHRSVGTVKLGIEAHRLKIVWSAVVGAALALVIFLLYSFLDAGTKGYFAWPLRLICLGLMAAACLLWLYLNDWQI